MSFIAKPLQGSEPCNRHSSRLLEVHAFWFRDERGFRATRVFGKGTFAHAEHIVAWLELRHRSPDRYYLASDVDPGPLPLHAPVQRIDGSGTDPYDDFVVLRNRLFEVLHFEDLSRFALGVDGGFHVGCDGSHDLSGAM